MSKNTFMLTQMVSF